MKQSILLLALVSQAAQASVNIHSFTPAANPAYTLSEDALQSSNWGAKGEGRLFFGAMYDMVNDPLVELDTTHNHRTQTLVDSMQSMNLSFAYGIVSRMQIGASTAMSTVTFPDHHTEFGIGDTRVFTKLRLNGERDTVAFAIMPELYIPTGRRSLFLSDDSLSGGMKFIAEHDFGSVTATGNAGYHYAPRATFRDLSLKSTIPLSLGLLIPVGHRWAINTEASGDISVPFNSYQNPSAVYAGLRYRLPSDFIVSFGGAAGSTNNYSSADFRVMAGITLMPQASKEVVVEQRPTPVIVATPLPAPKPRVVFTPKNIEISEEVKFEHNKALLTSSGRSILDEVAKVMRDNGSHFKFVIVEGHTNELGSVPHNMKLSKERAAAVKEYLVGRGVNSGKLQTAGYGKSRPKVTLADGLSQEARLAANRRVEFKVMGFSETEIKGGLATEKPAKNIETDGAVSGL